MAENTNNVIWSNPQTTPASYVQVDNTSVPNIVRLVEDPEIEKHIDFDEVSVEYQGAKSADGASSIKQEDISGTVYPIIRINDIVMSEDNIRYCEIKSEGFIPTIILELKFYNELFTAKDMPKDGDILSFFVKSSTDALNYLRDDFIITKCEGNDLGERTTKVSLYIEGKLFLQGMESMGNLYGCIGSSKKVIRETAKKFGLGFSYNDSDDTDDIQNWICKGSAVDFIKSVTEHSWKDNTSFFKSWVDLYYDLCFVNVNKFLLSTENSEDDVDITFNSITTEFQRLIHLPSDKNNALLSIKVLSNDVNTKGTPFYIRSWTPITNTSLSTTYGYSEISNVFYHNQGLFGKAKDNCVNVTNNIPAYDPAKTDTYMIMRGRASYDPLMNPEYEQARANHAYADEYVKFAWDGVAYVMADDDKNHIDNNNTWSGNVHKNYNRAPGHNYINNIELDKMYITVNLDGLCLQIMRGERIPIVIYHEGNLHPSALGSTNPNMPDRINRMYSGFYIIDSITYTYNGKLKDGQSRYTTTVNLKRREWPTPEMIVKDNEDTA